jgi:hypothetical protein
MARNTEIPSAVREQFDLLGQPQPMRRGSLSERYMKCGKAGCACGDSTDARHGPYLSLTRAVGGRTQSRLLSVKQGELVRRQVEAGQHFREQVESYWQVCEQWADAQLEESQAALQEAAKKRASKQGSQPRSLRRSRRS